MTDKDEDRNHYAASMTRRRFFDRIGDSLYGTALATLLSRDLYGDPGPLAVSFFTHSEF
jgi:hypothetical protein